METSRKKKLEIMQKGIISYQLSLLDWDVSEHLGDGCDLIAEKKNRFIKIELKSIDLSAIQKGKGATQHLSANEIVTSTHLIVTVFKGIEIKGNYIMSIRQFIENSGAKKINKYPDYETFISKYRQLNKISSNRKKNSPIKKERLDIDMSFNPRNQEDWKFDSFKEEWGNIDKNNC